MRIISGKFKGKNIIFLKTETTRPLKDSVKENIFNIMDHSNLINVSIEKSNILDLYSGIGSFGLECLSRGAKTITFVENEKKIIKILKDNLLNLSFENQINVVEDKVLNFLKTETKKKYEIIFFDPPFADDFFVEELKLIFSKKMYKKNHIVIIHRKSKSDDNLDEMIKPLVIKKYGRSKIIFGKFLS